MTSSFPSGGGELDDSERRAALPSSPDTHVLDALAPSCSCDDFDTSGCCFSHTSKISSPVRLLRSRETLP